jgi:uncharacterized cupredoxin-like copper-binding protein
MKRPLIIGLLVTVVVALIGSAAIVAGLTSARSSGESTSSAALPPGHPAPSSAPAGPKLPGTVVNVSLTDSGGPMGEGSGPLHAGAMGLTSDRAVVPHGKVSFRVTNAGTVNHEMVILPKAASSAVGTRPFGKTARVDEAGSLGEATSAGGTTGDEGIVPGGTAPLTVNLPPGQYEIVCNMMGHYVSGMFSKLTVT